MDLEQKYKKETGFDVGKIHDTGTTYYSEDYVEWLEKAIDYTPCCMGEGEQLVCEYCNDDAKPTCCDSCLERMINAVQKAN